jgi:hypothetical protein
LKYPFAYPAFILLLIGAFFAFAAWSVMQAADKGPQISDADYYSNGLKYSSTQFEKRTAAMLGWTVTTLRSGSYLKFTLLDREDRPVANANGRLTLPLGASASETRLALREEAPGIYLLEIVPAMRGEKQARLEFELSGARISRNLLLNL